MFEKLQVKPHVSSKVRAYGRARLDIARRAVTPQDWDQLWKPPQHPFPFTWGKYWKHCIEYRVDDFASEVGFFIDILGFPVIAFDPNYAMFTSPAGEFSFSVVQASEGSFSTPPDAIRIQFMVEDVYATTAEFAKRGIQFTQNPEPISEGSPLHTATFLTPHGICVDIWGEVRQAVAEVIEEATFEESESFFEEEGQETSEETDSKDATDEIDIDELFEEIRAEPEEKPKFENQARAKLQMIRETQTEDETPDELQYIDDTDENFPAYKPIPVRR